MKSLLWVLGIIGAGVLALYAVFKLSSRPTEMSTTAALATNTAQPAASGSRLGSDLAGAAALVTAAGGVLSELGVKFDS